MAWRCRLQIADWRQAPALAHLPLAVLVANLSSPLTLPARGELGGGLSMRRVVVTGLGVVSPNGIGKDAFWSACLDGKSGVRPIESFEAKRRASMPRLPMARRE